jgi:hypothetical protein
VGWCHPFAEKYQLRLVGGPEGKQDQEGRVEIARDEGVGGMCVDAMDGALAATICRQLGYASGVALQYGTYGNTNGGPLWLSSCNGTESDLLQCAGVSWVLGQCAWAWPQYECRCRDGRLPGAAVSCSEPIATGKAVEHPSKTGTSASCTPPGH